MQENVGKPSKGPHALKRSCQLKSKFTNSQNSNHKESCLQRDGKKQGGESYLNTGCLVGAAALCAASATDFQVSRFAGIRGRSPAAESEQFIFPISLWQPCLLGSDCQAYIALVPPLEFLGPYRMAATHMHIHQMHTCMHTMYMFMCIYI